MTAGVCQCGRPRATIVPSYASRLRILFQSGYKPDLGLNFLMLKNAQSAGEAGALRAPVLLGALAILGALPAILAVWFALFAQLDRREAEAIAGAATANVNLARTFSEHILGIATHRDNTASFSNDLLQPAR